MKSSESTTNPNKIHKLRQLATAAAVGALSLVGVGHNAGAQESPPPTEPSGEYTPPADGHVLVRPEDAVTTTTAAPETTPEYVPPADGHVLVNPGEPTTTTAPPEYVEPADGHVLVRPEDAVTTTTAAPTLESFEPASVTEQSPAIVAHDTIDSAQSESLPSTGLDAADVVGAGVAVAGAGALAARVASRQRSKTQ